MIEYLFPFLGAVGYFSFVEDLDTCIAIRTVNQKKKKQKRKTEKEETGFFSSKKRFSFLRLFWIFSCNNKKSFLIIFLRKYTFFKKIKCVCLFLFFSKKRFLFFFTLVVTLQRRHGLLTSGRRDRIRFERRWRIPSTGKATTKQTKFKKMPKKEKNLIRQLQKRISYHRRKIT